MNTETLPGLSLPLVKGISKNDLLTVLIKNNQSRLLLYRAALQSPVTEAISKRILRCLVAETEQNIFQLSDELGGYLPKAAPLPEFSSADNISILLLQNAMDAYRTYEAAMSHKVFDHKTRNLLQDQFTELKISLNILKMHSNKKVALLVA